MSATSHTNKMLLFTFALVIVCSCSGYAQYWSTRSNYYYPARPRPIYANYAAPLYYQRRPAPFYYRPEPTYGYYRTNPSPPTYYVIRPSPQPIRVAVPVTHPQPVIGNRGSNSTNANATHPLNSTTDIVATGNASIPLNSPSAITPAATTPLATAPLANAPLATTPAATTPAATTPSDRPPQNNMNEIVDNRVTSIAPLNETATSPPSPPNNATTDSSTLDNSPNVTGNVNYDNSTASTATDVRSSPNPNEGSEASSMS